MVQQIDLRCSLDVGQSINGSAASNVAWNYEDITDFEEIDPTAPRLSDDLELRTSGPTCEVTTAQRPISGLVAAIGALVDPVSVSIDPIFRHSVRQQVADRVLPKFTRW